jgi:hypothetical protein
MQNYGCCQDGAIAKIGHFPLFSSSLSGILPKNLADKRIIANFVHTFRTLNQ